MKSKTLTILISCLALSTILIGCTKNTTVGFGDDDPLTAELSDSIKVVASTYLLDSLPSSNTGTILLGKSNDHELGKINVASYFRIKPPLQTDFPKNASFDSLKLELKYSKYSYGDTAKLQQLAVYRLIELIKLRKVNSDVEPEEKPLFIKDEEALFTTSTFKYNPIAIGTHNYRPKPNGTDSVAIKMDEDLGKELFKMLENKDNRLANDNDFLDYFNGLRIEAKDGDAVIGFNTEDVKLKLYYHFQGDDGFKKNANRAFPLHDKKYQFNQVNADRQTTKLKNLSRTNREIQATDTDQQLFLQGGTGIVTKILLPGLTKFMQEPGVVVNKAELIIQTRPSSYALYKAPASLILLIANKVGVPKFIVSNSYGAGNQEARFYPGNDNGRLANYTFNLTEYVNKIRKDEYKNTSLLLSLPIDDFIKTANRLQIVNDKSTLSISTRITYTKYK